MFKTQICAEHPTITVTCCDDGTSQFCFCLRKHGWYKSKNGKKWYCYQCNTKLHEGLTDTDIYHGSCVHYSSMGGRGFIGPVAEYLASMLSDGRADESLTQPPPRLCPGPPPLPMALPSSGPSRITDDADAAMKEIIGFHGVKAMLEKYEREAFGSQVHGVVTADSDYDFVHLCFFPPMQFATKFLSASRLLLRCLRS